MICYLKSNMVERKEDMKGCKSPTHVEGCPCTMCQKPVESCKKCPVLNTQHSIPRCIGRQVLGMDNKQLDAYTHKESKVCHRENDVRVPTVLFEMKLRKSEGMKYSKEAVLKMRENNYFHG
jgi:hypothetical protein